MYNSLKFEEILYEKLWNHFDKREKQDFGSTKCLSSLKYNSCFIISCLSCDFRFSSSEKCRFFFKFWPAQSKRRIARAIWSATSWKEAIWKSSKRLVKKTCKRWPTGRLTTVSLDRSKRFIFIFDSYSKHPNTELVWYSDGPDFEWLINLDHLT